MAIDPALLTYRIFILFEFVASGMAIASITYTGWYVLSAFSVRVGDIKPENVLMNSTWFLTISLILFDILGLACFLYSIVLMISPVKAGYITRGFGRALAFVVLGFGAFGTSAMGGIIAGSVCWFAGFCAIVASCLTKMGCLVPWTTEQRIQNEEDEKEAKAQERKIKQERKEKEKEEKKAAKEREKEEKKAAKEREKAEREERKNVEENVVQENELTVQTDDAQPTSKETIPL